MAKQAYAIIGADTVTQSYTYLLTVRHGALLLVCT